MNAKQIALVLIVLIGIGLYALPSTVSLFAGQHSFVNIDGAGNQIDCEKCHSDVASELHVAGAPHSDFTCAACHRIELGKASGDDSYAEITYKNAVSGATRKLIVLTGDMYALNVPEEMTENTTAAQVKDLVTLSGNPTSSVYKSAPYAGLSPCYPAANCTDVAGVLTVQSVTSMQAKLLTGVNGTINNGQFKPWAVTYTTTNTGVSYAANFTGVGTKTSNPGTSYHAAAIPSCLFCHGGEAPQSHHDAEYRTMSDNNASGCVACHYEVSSKGLTAQIVAGGFGMTEAAGDTGASEVHKAFQTANPNMSPSQVCSLCHTHGLVDITYTKPTTAGFTVDGTVENSTISVIVTGGATTTHTN